MPAPDKIIEIFVKVDDFCKDFLSQQVLQVPDMKVWNISIY
jgi:hypothetical protein